MGVKWGQVSEGIIYYFKLGSIDFCVAPREFCVIRLPFSLKVGFLGKLSRTLSSDCPWTPKQQHLL